MADRDVLPDNVKPLHYILSLRDLDFDKWSYRGTVTIHLQVVRPTKQIVLNSLQLKLRRATLAPRSSSSTTPSSAPSLETTAFSYDDKAQRVTISFDDEIPASSDGVALVVDFDGIMNDEMAGFYRSRYKPVVPALPSVPRDDDWHYMLSTQFESCDARRAFPCLDEPNLKATFDFQIEVPVDQTALSNMPVSGTEPTRNGWHLVSFDTTPRMSTYLLAWAVGDFAYVEAHTDRRYKGRQLPVRVYTTRGLEEQGRWALQHAPKIIDFFSQIFKIDYPLPKADLLAVHEFTHGAMENWGLITYRTTQLLFDEKTSDARFKNAVAYVVAHELAHQWFGNLVTMDWWDELWLNEGFATWVGWHAVDYIHPEWQVWAQFVNEGMEAAFRLDGIRSSHPIQVPVRDALDINQIFDSISYLKGCSAIRMLANHLGVETFLGGVSNYLKAHMYGNARTKALWDALSEASGQDVGALMGPWISKVGHPVLTVTEEPGQIIVSQSRFLSTGDVKGDEDATVWWVPLGLAGKKGHSGVTDESLTKKRETIGDVDLDFYKLNSGATGFYRVNYSPDRLVKLATQLDRLSTEDRIALIGSTADLAYAGDTTTASLLTLLEAFGGEDHPLVWTQILDSISSLKSVFADDKDIKGGLEKFSLKVIDRKLKQLGWEFPPDEDYLTGNLRKQLIGVAAACGHAEIVQEAMNRFDAWAADPQGNPIHPTLRGPVWRAAVRKDGQRAVPIIKKEWFETRSIDGKLICLQALSVTEDEKLLREDIVPFNLEPGSPRDSVPAADMHVLGLGLAANPVARGLQWAHMKEHWDRVVTKLGNPIIVDRFVRVSLGSFTHEAAITDLDAFFDTRDTKAFDRTLATVKDKIRSRAAYRQRETGAPKDWLASHGYL